MRVDDVCEVKVTGRVLGLVRDAKIKVANAPGELLLYASVLQPTGMWKTAPVRSRQTVLHIYDSLIFL